MKKIVVAVVVLFLAITKSFSSVGLGAELGFTFSTAENRGGIFSATIKHSAIPCVVALGGGIYSDGFDVSFAADWWLSNPHLQGALHWYYGPGMAARFSFTNEGSVQFKNTTLLPRMVIGTNLYPLDMLEMYLQTALELGVAFYLHEEGNTTVRFPRFRIPLNAGIRFWF